MESSINEINNAIRRDGFERGYDSDKTQRQLQFVEENVTEKMAQIILREADKNYEAAAGVHEMAGVSYNPIALRSHVIASEIERYTHSEEKTINLASRAAGFTAKFSRREQGEIER